MIPYLLTSSKVGKVSNKCQVYASLTYGIFIQSSQMDYLYLARNGRDNVLHGQV